MKKIIYKLTTITVIFLFLGAIFPSVSLANEGDEQKYYIGSNSLVNTGKDNGYSKNNAIKKSDPHFGWALGSFYISGYTRVTEESSDSPVFLKNVGDKVALGFLLEQDITHLNGESSLSISGDKNGYDEHFGIEKTDMGHGTLIIRHTDYQNKEGVPTLYTDYLAANMTTDADTQVELFEEGDYEVSLLYEIKDDPRKVYGLSIFPSYSNYRVSLRFSVRNGNCMVFPFDVETGEELTHTAITENGFYLDLAKSRYLDIDIMKEVLEEGATGLTEDVRFNRPAKDGDQYTDEGIYTITVSNGYTGQETTKKIYVGTNDILKAYVTTGFPIQEIAARLSSGAEIAENGTIIYPDPESSEPLGQEPDMTISPESNGDTQEEDSTQGENDNSISADVIETEDYDVRMLPVAAGSAIVVGLFAFVMSRRKRHSQKVDAAEVGEEDGE